MSEKKEAGIADSARGSEGTVGAQQYYVTVSDLPPFAGRCEATVRHRFWTQGNWRHTSDQCSRSASYAYNGNKFCIQHHPDPDEAQRGIEREQKIAERAYRAAKAAR